MNFQSLEYFIVLARERNYTRAAEALHITQQSLSAHIATLEKELDCVLVVRHTPLELTYAGRTFLRYAAGIRKQQRDLYREFADIAGNQRGELRIGIAATRGRVIMPEIIPAFQENYPNVTVILTEDTNENLQKRLAEGNIDLAVAKFDKPPEEIGTEDFYEEHVVLLVPEVLWEKCIAQGEGESFEAERERIERGDLTRLGGCPFVLGNDLDIAAGLGKEMLRNSGITPTVRFRCDNMETLLTLCRKGTGACFCPENLVRTVITEKQLAEIKLFRFRERMSYPIRFGYLKQSYQWNMISEFMRIAGERYGAAFGGEEKKGGNRE